MSPINGSVAVDITVLPVDITVLPVGITVPPFTEK
jgi:hypothetical protein